MFTFILQSWTFRAGLRGVQFTNTNDGATAYNGWSPYVSAARLLGLVLGSILWLV